jgi:hypothetical protein
VASRLDPAQLRLYRLIWQRYVASQMVPARLSIRAVDVDAAPSEGATSYTLRASTSDVTFPGYMRVTGVERQAPKDDAEDDEEAVAAALPPLTEGEALDLLEWLTERKETKPPPRFSEAALVRALEEYGIGRPSTYAQIIGTLHAREYVLREKRVLSPTDLGMQVSDLLTETLSELFDVTFTANMENSLDEVENGSVRWDGMLADFYTQFSEWMVKTAAPKADEAALDKVLNALTAVTTWNPAVKNGKRVYSDEKFVESVRKQRAEGKKAVSEKQLEALFRIAYRYREQSPGVEDLMKDLGYGKLLEDPGIQPPDEATMRKLALLETIEMDEKTKDFVGSLRSRCLSGRCLTAPQLRALDRVVIGHAKLVPDFETIRGGLELGAQPDEGPDEESGPLLEAMNAVKTWNEPVTRGRRVFDDAAFHRSLSRQFARKGSLSERQRAALKRMVGRYREQIAGFPELQARFQIGSGRPKGKRGARPHGGTDDSAD